MDVGRPVFWRTTRRQLFVVKRLSVLSDLFQIFAVWKDLTVVTKEVFYGSCEMLFLHNYVRNGKGNLLCHSD